MHLFKDFSLSEKTDYFQTESWVKQAAFALNPGAAPSVVCGLFADSDADHTLQCESTPKNRFNHTLQLKENQRSAKAHYQEKTLLAAATCF